MPTPRRRQLPCKSRPFAVCRSALGGSYHLTKPLRRHALRREKRQRFTVQHPGNSETCPVEVPRATRPTHWFGGDVMHARGSQLSLVACAGHPAGSGERQALSATVSADLGAARKLLRETF